MVLIETSVFTRRVGELLDEEQYRLLQLDLVRTPTAGSVIPGSSGLRKLRWRAHGRGKRGGTRVIYYWIEKRETLLLLLIYTKSECDRLLPNQRAALRRLVEEEFVDG